MNTSAERPRSRWERELWTLAGRSRDVIVPARVFVARMLAGTATLAPGAPGGPMGLKVPSLYLGATVAR
jgi:H+/Cl- antiporter ClcA